MGEREKSEGDRMRVLELIGGLLVSWVLAVGVYHSLKFLVERRRGNANTRRD